VLNGESIPMLHLPGSKQLHTDLYFRSEYKEIWRFNDQDPWTRYKWTRYR
jgi:hypothetical protein